MTAFVRPGVRMSSRLGLVHRLGCCHRVKVLARRHRIGKKKICLAVPGCGMDELLECRRENGVGFGSIRKCRARASEVTETLTVFFAGE